MKGYVGVGIVKEKARPVTEFEVEVDGQQMPILEAPLAEPEKADHDAGNPELREHMVRVEWLKTGRSTMRSGRRVCSRIRSLRAAAP